MPEYHFQGTASLGSVDFYIFANSLEEAKAKAKRGEFDNVEDDTSEMLDWAIDETTGEENG